MTQFNWEAHDAAWIVISHLYKLRTVGCFETEWFQDRGFGVGSDQSIEQLNQDYQEYIVNRKYYPGK